MMLLANANFLPVLASSILEDIKMQTYKHLFLNAIAAQYLELPKWQRDEEWPNPIDDVIYNECSDFGPIYPMAVSRVFDAINAVQEAVQHTVAIQRSFYKDMHGNIMFSITFPERAEDGIAPEMYIALITREAIEECEKSHTNAIDYDIYLYDRRHYSSKQWVFVSKWLTDLRRVYA